MSGFVTIRVSNFVWAGVHIEVKSVDLVFQLRYLASKAKVVAAGVIRLALVFMLFITSTATSTMAASEASKKGWYIAEAPAIKYDSFSSFLM